MFKLQTFTADPCSTKKISAQPQKRLLFIAPIKLSKGVAMLIDYHVHTAMSGDAEGELTEYVKTARKRSLTEIGVSDHYHPEQPKYSMTNEKLAEYVKKVQQSKKTTDFPLKLGIEVDFIPNLQNKIEKVVKPMPFDYVIGSVHFINNWGFDNPKYISGYQKWDIAELYEAYFSLIQKCAKSRLFDIIAHPDLIKKFGYKPKTDISHIYLNTVNVLKESNVCVEVNTGGLRAPCREIYPTKPFLKMCLDNGIPITLGSDAHIPENVGKDFSQAQKLIKEVGYKNITRFTHRKPELVRIQAVSALK